MKKLEIRTKNKEQRTKLSVVILSYNTKELLINCLESVIKYANEVPLEIIVVDNASTDGSVEKLIKLNKLIKLIESKENLGFARGNNLAKEVVRGEYVLFLNSDTLVHELTLKETVKYLDDNNDCGVVTVKMVLPFGELDKDARRRFPTPWISLLRFSGFGGKYWYSDVSSETIQEIEVAQGAYFLTRKKILDIVGWFSTEYFLDGEDIDLSWKIKQKGWKIVYLPTVFITHFKKASKKNLKLSLKEKFKYKMAGINSMEIFYRKFMWKRYPFYINWLVILGIKALKLVRGVKLILFS